MDLLDICEVEHEVEPLVVQFHPRPVRLIGVVFEVHHRGHDVVHGDGLVRRTPLLTVPPTDAISPCLGARSQNRARQQVIREKGFGLLRAVGSAQGVGGDWHDLTITNVDHVLWPEAWRLRIWIEPRNPDILSETRRIYRVRVRVEAHWRGNPPGLTLAGREQKAID